MKNKPDTVFKVTYSPSEEKYVSYTGPNTKTEVIYKRRHYVTAPEWLSKQGYHLLCFDTLSHAKNLLVVFPKNKYQIWSCKALNKTVLPPQCDLANLFIGVLQPIAGDWPIGTVMYEKVMLWERVM